MSATYPDSGIPDSVDLVIIGAGVVGAAIAAAAAERGESVVVLEKEGRGCTGISSRNSGVIHSGLYYPPDSLKARSCVRGQALLYEWCERHGVPHRKSGKVVVAEPDEMDALHRLFDNARASGARDCELLSAAALADRVPNLPPLAGALYCPHSGIVDSHALTASLLTHARSHNAIVATHAPLLAVDVGAGGWHLESGRGLVIAPQVVNAAGLYADEVAALFGAKTPPIYPCRGDYFRVHGKLGFETLVYPLKKPAGGGLGIHLTLELDGGVKLGPDAEYVDGKDDFGPAEHKKDAFLAAAERILGPLDASRIHWDSCGIRPKLRGPDDTQDADFMVADSPGGLFHLLGIESPGLTACMALAEDVIARL